MTDSVSYMTPNPRFSLVADEFSWKQTFPHYRKHFELVSEFNLEKQNQLGRIDLKFTNIQQAFQKLSLVDLSSVVLVSRAVSAACSSLTVWHDAHGCRRLCTCINADRC